MHFLRPMKKLNKKHVGVLALVGVAGIALLSFSVFPSEGIIGKKNATDNIAEVTLRDFIPGTKVGYRISSGAKTLRQDQTQIDQNGILALPLDKTGNNNDLAQDIIKYELSVSPAVTSTPELQQTAAEMLRVMLALDPKSGDIDIRANGLEGFSSLTLKENNNQTQQLRADWAGLFKAKLQGVTSRGTANPKDNKQLELVFQNAGIYSDLLKDQMGMPKIDVQTGTALGDSSGSTLEKVQERWSSAMIVMTLQLSAVLAKQTQIIGTFFDASIQLATQRKLQELQARAHKDYHPSEQMCRVGSYMRSIAHTQSKAELEKTALNKYLIEAYTGVKNAATSQGSSFYEASKFQNYVEKYCDSADNGGATSALCNGSGVSNMDGRNKDIDYTRLVEVPLTLNINYTDGSLVDDEADVLALARYLYFPSAFHTPKKGGVENDIRPHYDSRSYAAKMAVAHNSFVNIIGLKAAAASTEDSGWSYMKAMLLSDFDLSESDINKMLGEDPSYYAQMEILTKKIYQNPNFYINLYDKPANVKRIGAALDAIMLMSERDRYESMLRREMLSALMLEDALQEDVEEINSGMLEEMQNSQVPK